MRVHYGVQCKKVLKFLADWGRVHYSSLKYGKRKLVSYFTLKNCMVLIYKLLNVHNLIWHGPSIFIFVSNFYVNTHSICNRTGLLWV